MIINMMLTVLASDSEHTFEFSAERHHPFWSFALVTANSSANLAPNIVSNHISLSARICHSVNQIFCRFKNINQSLACTVFNVSILKFLSNILVDWIL